MRTLLLVFAFLFSVPVFCQISLDSMALIKQVDSLILVSREFKAKGDFDQALEVLASAEKLSLKEFGQESAAYGHCCHNRGRIHDFMQDFPEAEKWLLQAIDIRGKVLGKVHPDYAISLASLAFVYTETGNYPKAEQLHLEAIAIQEKTLGKEQPYYVAGLTNLGTLYVNMGNFEKAETLFLEAMIIQEKLSGKEDPSYAGLLNNLAIVYVNTGNYEKAEPLYLEASSILEKTVGKVNPDYAGGLINLAHLYLNMGNYEKAESLFLEAKDIFEVRLNLRSHPNYMNCLDNLAALYTELGNYEKAKLLTLESLDIRAKVQGKEHPDYAQSLSLLAISYGSTGNWKEAESPLLDAFAIREKTLGKEHILYTHSLYNLACCYSEMRDFDKAEQYFLQAMAIQEKLLGRNHPDYASSLDGLASSYLNKGTYDKAEPLFYEAKAILEKVMGRVSPDYLGCLDNLAGFYFTTGNYEKVEPLLAEIASINRSQITNALHHLSEMEMQYYMKRFSKGQDNALGFAQMTKGNKSAPLCFDNSLFYKGFLLNAAEQVKRLTQTDSAAIEKFNQLKAYQRRLASHYSLPIVERDSTLILDLEERANMLEKDLARTVAGYGAAMRQINWQEVQAVLKPGEVAIEFVHYSAGQDSIMYAALLLRPEDDQPQYIPLFEQKQLENLLQSNSGKARKADYVNAVYGFKTEVNSPEAQKSLYELVWQPLDKVLAGSTAVDLSRAGTKTVYFSPSGLLHRLNLSAIPIHEKETLSDRYHLVELGSTRQLVIFSESKNGAPDAGQALLFGGVQYDLNSDSIASRNLDLETSLTDTRGELGFSYTDSINRAGTWTYLKWTDKEVTALKPILRSAHIQPTIRKGYAATEEAFKSIGVNQPSPRILHIATHGFFFPDPSSAPGRESTLHLGQEPSFKISDHPMIRSGLILAGGNHAWKTGKPFKEGMEDGILTAYEISQMDLSNTELVVLSACETGLGDIQGNEGVYGLQRAFKIAGAKYLIMSLWQVPDFQTQELMTTFYTNWLTKKQPIPDAFRAAQQVMREKYEHPYFWAGFVLVE